MNGTRYKPQIHVSMLNTLSRCGIQFQRRYGERFGIWHKTEIIPPSIALITGISVHKSVEQNLKAKLESGRALTLDEAVQVARDSWGELAEGEIRLSDEERVNVKKTIAEAIDQAIGLAMLHHHDVAPKIKPVAVEEPFVIELQGCPIDIAGQIDCREKRAIRDAKTSGKSPNVDGARTMQMAMYALSRKVIAGGFPELVAVDYLVKTKTPKAVTIEAKPDHTWINPLMARVENFISTIEAVKTGHKALTPAQPDDWMCSRKWCGYAETCPYWSGR